jgi:hypothetical protein
LFLEKLCKGSGMEARKCSGMVTTGTSLDCCSLARNRTKPLFSWHSNT